MEILMYMSFIGLLTGLFALLLACMTFNRTTEIYTDAAKYIRRGLVEDVPTQAHIMGMMREEYNRCERLKELIKCPRIRDRSGVVYKVEKVVRGYYMVNFYLKVGKQQVIKSYRIETPKQYANLFNDLQPIYEITPKPKTNTPTKIKVKRGSQLVLQV